MDLSLAVVQVGEMQEVQQELIQFQVELDLIQANQVIVLLVVQPMQVLIQAELELELVVLGAVVVQVQ